MPSSSSSFFLPIFLAITHSLIPVASISCPPQNLTCGHRTLDIQFPFFTSQSSPQCSGLHFIQCMNNVPTVHFRGLGYLYPITDISYNDKTIIIHDINLSAYYMRSDCIFLYDFDSPVPDFGFNYFSISLNSGESFFDCRKDYDFGSDVFLLNNNLSLCKDYRIHYSGDFGRPKVATFAAKCRNYSNPGFHWKLSFGGGGGTALVAAGFSPEWTKRKDCFRCELAASSNCSGVAVAGDSSCGCRSSCQEEKNNDSRIIIGVSIAAGILLISILSFIGFRWHLRRQQKRRLSSSSTLLSHHCSIKRPPFSIKTSDLTYYPCPTQVFSYQELHEATKAFVAALEIGGGGSGAVYKGTLRDGRTVAVKRPYEKNNKRAEQFANEIVILSRLRHQNLVSLYGCTSPRCRELLLVYEFVANGTVADHLHGPRAAEGHLTWPRRLSIAVETAAALAYLHAADPPVVHRDIKTVNILLDAEFHVKIADFGLSRLVPGGGAAAGHICTAPQGTPGYIDPDYQRSYQLTDRSDVYSFGVVLAELLSSKPAVDVGRERPEINLSAMAVNRIQSGSLDDLVDRRLGYDSDAETRKKMSLVADLSFRCLKADREMRPAMKEVLEVLIGLQNGALMVSETAGHFVEHVVGNAGADKEGDEQSVSPDTVTE